MSYLVLARKYRPRNFKEVKGQDHTVQALVNALDHERLHHAYVFSGTRGVGKTTLGRILAQSMNCEEGVSSNPCEKCATCTAFREGNFLDLIEVDAASRTGVDDMREMLENANLQPSMGRFRVYLIDEVHMLSTASFNALLKTLEEPPGHVKFVLATTESKKIPITVLSRCLQFHLRNIPPDIISQQLKEVLASEEVEAESEAMNVIARAADGSIRDALSIADQAISHGGGSITLDSVSSMLGTARTNEVAQILQLIVDGDRPGLLEFVDSLGSRSLSYADLIQNLQRAMHAMALFHATNKLSDEFLKPFAEKLSPEWLQVAYQVLLMGMRDLRYAPDHRSGFDMTILRLMDFEPVAAYPAVGPPSGRAQLGQKTVDSKSTTASEITETSDKEESVQSKTIQPVSDQPIETVYSVSQQSQDVNTQSSPTIDRWSSKPWHELINELDFSHDLKRDLQFCEMVPNNSSSITLRVSKAHGAFLTSDCQLRIREHIESQVNDPVSVVFEIGETQTETPRERLDRIESERAQQKRKDRESKNREAEARIQEAHARLQEDPFVQRLKDEFDAKVLDIRWN